MTGRERLLQRRKSELDLKRVTEPACEAVVDETQREGRGRRRAVTDEIEESSAFVVSQARPVC